MYLLPWTFCKFASILTENNPLKNGNFLKLSAKPWKMLYNRKLLLKTLTVAGSRFNVFIAFRPWRWTAAWGKWSILIPPPPTDSSPEFGTNFITETRPLVTIRSVFFKLNLGPVIRPRNHIDVSTDTEPSAARNSRFFFFFDSFHESSLVLRLGMDRFVVFGHCWF